MSTYNYGFLVGQVMVAFECIPRESQRLDWYDEILHAIGFVWDFIEAEDQILSDSIGMWIVQYVSTNRPSFLVIH